MMLRNYPESWHLKLWLFPEIYRQKFVAGSVAVGTSVNRDVEYRLLPREIIGSDCLMWRSDYPHNEGTFEDIPEDEKRKVEWT